MERTSINTRINVNGSREEARVPVRVERAASRERNRSRELAAIGMVAAAAFVALPRISGEAPTSAEPSYTEAVQESVKMTPSYNPETDEIVIDGIHIKPNNPAKNTPSEAVLSNSEVRDYMAEHPEEKAAIITSANSLPSMTKEAAIALRDVDSDGDTDAIAIQVK